MASELNSQDGWFCEKHPKKEAELFCETHEAAICQVCGLTKNHKSCDMQDIHDVIGERKRCLLDKVAKAKLKSKVCNDSYSTVVQQSQEIEDNFEELMNRKIKNPVNEEMEQVKGEREGKAFQMNKEADDEIAKMTEQINERRRERLRENDKDYDSNIKKIEVKRDGLKQDFEKYKLKFEQTSKNNKTHCQDLLATLTEALSNAEKLVNEEKHLLTDFRQVTQLLDKGLKTEINVQSVGNISITSIEKGFSSMQLVNKRFNVASNYRQRPTSNRMVENRFQQYDPYVHATGYVKNKSFNM